MTIKTEDLQHILCSLYHCRMAELSFIQRVTDFDLTWRVRVVFKGFLNSPSSFM